MRTTITTLVILTLLTPCLGAGNRFVADQAAEAIAAALRKRK